MPRNEVVERMAKRLQDAAYSGGQSARRWKRTSEKIKNYWRNDALELLGIVEENCEKRNFPTLDGIDVFIIVGDELRDAFQLAREAKKRGKK